MKFPILSDIFRPRKILTNTETIILPVVERRLKEEEEGKAAIGRRDQWNTKFDDEEQNLRNVDRYFNAYYNFPIVAAAIDNKVEQVVQDFRFEGPDKVSLMKWADTVNLKHHLRRICKDGLIAGTIWAEKVGLDRDEVKGLGRLKDPITFKHIDSRTMRIYRTAKGKMLCHMQETNGKKIVWGTVPEGIKADKGGDLEDMFCWKWNLIGSNKYGTSIINSSITMLEIKNQMESDMKTIIKRYIAPVVHAKIGDELHPANEEMVNEMQSKLEDIYADTEYVTNHLVSMEVLDFKNKGVDPKPIIDHVDSQILVGLQTHAVLLATIIGDSGEAEKSAEIRLRANGRHIRAIQDELKLAIEDQILFPMTDSIKNKLIWESVEERQFEADVDILTTLVKNGVLTKQKANDLLPDEYQEKLPEDLMLNPMMASDQKVPSDEKVKDNPTDPTKSTNTADGSRVNKSEHLNIPNAKSKPQKDENLRRQ